jgi:hypothetical protein
MMNGFHMPSELYPVYGQDAVNSAFQRCIACAGQTYSMYDGSGHRIGEGRQAPSPSTTAIPERHWNVFIENVKMMHE